MRSYIIVMPSDPPQWQKEELNLPLNYQSKIKSAARTANTSTARRIINSWRRKRND